MVPAQLLALTERSGRLYSMEYVRRGAPRGRPEG
jgi:hypothetical protein